MDPSYTIDGVGAAEPLADRPLRERIIAKEVDYDGIESIEFDRFYPNSDERKRTALAAANIDGHKVFLKAFWVDMSDTERLDYEHCVYDYMYHHGVKDGRLINFVPYVATIYRTADKIEELYEAAESKSAKKMFFGMLRHLRNTEIAKLHAQKKTEEKKKLAEPDAQVKILVIEMIENTTTLYKYVSEGELAKADPRALPGIVAQIMFALYQMEKLQMQHNDLHTDNIMVQTRGAESGTMFYAADGRELMLGHAIPKIWLFDFDLAACVRCGRNELDTGFCGPYGICNELNPRFDLYTVLRHLAVAPELAGNAEFQAFVHRAVSGKVEPERFKHRLCHPDPKLEPFMGPKTPCTKFPEGEPASVMTPKKVVQDKYFDSVAI